MKSVRTLLLFILALVPVGHAAAQVDAAGTMIIIPVVSSSSTFQSEISVKDQSGTTRAVTFDFYEGQTSASPGKKACGSVSLNGFQTKTVTLAAQCGLAGNHHGFVILTDASANRDKLFYAFSRVSNFGGAGFSVEGYPIGHIGGGDDFSEVIGAKRVAATASTPAYDTNCFVVSLNNPVHFTILVEADQTRTLEGDLPAFGMKRFLNIFDAVGAAPGNYQNATVTFLKDIGDAGTLIGYCTVQDFTSFGADFRLSKNWNAGDPSRFRLNCFAASFGTNPGECSTLQPSAPAIPNATTKIRLLTRIYGPDTVNCSILGPRAADLEMQLVLDSPPSLAAGGNNAQSFKYTIANRASIGAGYHELFWLEVGFREGGNATFPIPFGIRCMSGNGMMEPRVIDAPADNF
jgi:hypothetical protein